MDNKMFILQGNETPEQLMIYLKNYDEQIYNNVSLAPLEKLAFLKRIIDKEAQTIVSNVEANFKDYTEVEDVDEIHHHQIREEIRAEFDTDDKIRSYFSSTGSAVYKKRQIEHII